MFHSVEELECFLAGKASPAEVKSLTDAFLCAFFVGLLIGGIFGFALGKMWFGV